MEDQETWVVETWEEGGEEILGVEGVALVVGEDSVLEMEDSVMAMEGLGMKDLVAQAPWEVEVGSGDQGVQWVTEGVLMEVTGWAMVPWVKGGEGSKILSVNSCFLYLP